MSCLIGRQGGRYFETFFCSLASQIVVAPKKRLRVYTFNESRKAQAEIATGFVFKCANRSFNTCMQGECPENKRDKS